MTYYFLDPVNKTFSTNVNPMFPSETMLHLGWSLTKEDASEAAIRRFVTKINKLMTEIETFSKHLEWAKTVDINTLSEVARESH